VRWLSESARRAVPELVRDLLVLPGRPRVAVFVVSPAAGARRGLLPTLTRSIEAAVSTGLQAELLVLDYDADVDAQLSTRGEQDITVRRFWREAVVGTDASMPHRITSVKHPDTPGQPLRRAVVDGDGRLVRTVDLHPRTGQEVTHRYSTGDGRCWLSVWIDPDDGTPGRAFQHLPAARAFASLRAAQASWVREAISTTGRPLLIAGDRTGEDVLRAVRRIGATKRALAGEVTAAHWRALVSDAKSGMSDAMRVSLRLLSDSKLQ